ncbi:hypothetical protein KHQ81_08580 [Mycoplasmatota bacterium]|nr:hypothetical protein KHQ81_08580 [Mycoplasmatota bacterium]
MKKIKKGVYDVPLIVSESLKRDYDGLKQTIISAQERIVEFAKRYNFLPLIEPSFMERVEIYDSQEAFKERLISFLNLNRNIELPKTISAVLENKVLISISSKEYQNIYPIEGEDRLGFERLLTHELAHRFHVRILDGNEEAMGPNWFFEGFAIFASKQFLNFTCSEATIWDIIKNEKQVAYKYYAAIFSYLTKEINLNDLIHHAKDDNFYEWLRERIN